MIAHIKAIAKKEVRQLLRDSRMLFVVFFFPVFLLIVFGYAINFDVENIKLALYDLDKSDMSREFTETLTSSEYFNIVKVLDNDGQIKETLDGKLAQTVLVIPKDFSRNIFSGKETAKVQLLVDGVDGNTASIISKYIGAITNQFRGELQAEFLARSGGKAFIPVDFRPIFWFNPTLESTKYLIPGLIAMILIVTAVISMSLSLVREKERGTIEQINVSSLNTLELLIGKSIPYIIISVINAAFILVAGFVLFGVAVQGSIILLAFSTLVFILASISFGILVSVIADSQQVAFTIATFATLLPSIILSGFIFPIESMPPFIQVITNITPAKFFIVILRDIILKGVGLSVFWDQMAYLIIFTLCFLFLATKIRTKKESQT